MGVEVADLGLVQVEAIGRGCDVKVLALQGAYVHVEQVTVEPLAGGRGVEAGEGDRVEQLSAVLDIGQVVEELAAEVWADIFDVELLHVLGYWVLAYFHFLLRVILLAGDQVDIELGGVDDVHDP